MDKRYIFAALCLFQGCSSSESTASTILLEEDRKRAAMYQELCLDLPLYWASKPHFEEVTLHYYKFDSSLLIVNGPKLGLIHPLRQRYCCDLSEKTVYHNLAWREVLGESFRFCGDSLRFLVNQSEGLGPFKYHSPELQDYLDSRFSQVPISREASASLMDFYVQANLDANWTWARVDSSFFWQKITQEQAGKSQPLMPNLDLITSEQLNTFNFFYAIGSPHSQYYLALVLRRQKLPHGIFNYQLSAYFIEETYIKQD